MALSVMIITGCKTISLKEDRFIHPQASEQRVEFILPNYQFNEHHVIRSDGTLAHGISMTRASNQFSILFFGGNKFSIAEKGEAVIKQLSHFNVDIYMFDHRGYGLSTGEPTLKLLMNDAVENFDYVKSKTNGNLILHGHSLGSFEAGWVAKNRQVDALVLESSITHIDDWVEYLALVPWLLKPFIRFDIKQELRIVNNDVTVKQLNSPLLLMVGSKDKVTPKILSERLYQASNSSDKILHVFEKANHTNVRSHHQFNAVYQRFINMLPK